MTGVPTPVNTSDLGTKILSKACVKALKYLIRMVDEDDQRIGNQEYEEIYVKEELRKNKRKMAKAVGGSAKIALVLAFPMLQGGKAVELQEDDEMAENDETSWWIWLLFTLLCLSSVRALSLARRFALSIVQ